MHDERHDRLWSTVRETYHVPPPTPREEMWSSIAAQLRPDEKGVDGVADLEAARRAKRAREASAGGSNRPLGWAVAAAAVLVMGIGIGRMTAPAGSGAAVAPGASTVSSARSPFQLVAQEHLGRTESLLTMVRADARGGRLDPATAEWAKGLLAETRLLIDAQNGADPAVGDLLLDLELVLAQIVGVAESGSMDDERARTELELAMRSLDQGEVLPRIQRVLPAFSGV